MAENLELTTAVGKLNVATNKLRDGQTVMATAVDGASVRFWALAELVKTNMTPAEVAAVKDALDVNTNILDAVVTGMDATVASLNGLAANPTNPVPQPPPEPPVIPVP